MKIGLGLYRHMLTCDYSDFARQAGCLTLWFTWSITSTRAHPTPGIISRLAQSTNRGDL
jgi:hypothetical protein